MPSSPLRVVVQIVEALGGFWRALRQLKGDTGCPEVTREAGETANRGVKLDDDFLSATAKASA